MSFIANGGANIFIGAPVQGTPQTQNWTFTWGSSGWQGNTFNEPQPLNTDASMTYSEESVSLNSDGTYSFSYSITNNGPNSTQYNIQTSNN
jgi:hypothetical protein